MRTVRFEPIAALVATALLSAAVSAADSRAPSNAELYRMILELKSEQATVRKEAAEAKAEAAAAKSKLNRTAEELERTQEELREAKKQLAGRMEPPAKRVEPERVVQLPDDDGGVKVAAQALYLRPSVDRLGYAIVNPIDGPVPGQPGANIEPGLGSSLRAVEPGHELGFRVSGAYAVPGTGRDITVHYSHLDARETDQVIEPAGGEIVSPLTASRTGAEDADRAEAEFSLGFRAIDLELGQTVALGLPVDLRVFGGLRYGMMEPSLTARYFGDNFDPITPGIVTITSEFDGIGPRVGAAAQYAVGGGFSLVGGVATSVLVGDFEAQFLQRMEDPGGATDFNREVRDETTAQLVPVFEANLGVEFARQFGGVNVKAKAAYELEHWFGAYGFSQLPSGTGAAGGVDSQLIKDRTDVGLQGGSLRLEVEF